MVFGVLRLVEVGRDDGKWKERWIQKRNTFCSVSVYYSVEEKCFEINVKMKEFV